jgi:hypothetical protein
MGGTPLPVQKNISLFLFARALEGNRFLLLFAFFLFACLSRPDVIFPSKIAFEHILIDERPPSGDGCCLDVCAVGDLDMDGKMSW